MVADMPKLDRTILKEFTKFVAKWIKNNITRLPKDTDVSVQYWLDNSNYPLARCEELIKIANSGYDINKRKYYRCKSFIKDEPYVTYKNPRTINSRTDVFKVFTGPIFAAMEKAVFKLKYFMKKVPFEQRCDYLKTTVYAAGAKYHQTDYSNFEQSFSPEFMLSCELELYRYLSRDLPGGKEWFDVVRTALTGRTFMCFRDVIASIDGRRASGDMCTSLGNSFSNLMLSLFCARRSKCEWYGTVEGDDGLYRTVPDNCDMSIVKKLGFDLKSEVALEFNEASFCGMIYDVETKTIMTDPTKSVSQFAWLDRKYSFAPDHVLLELLRAKSLSLAYQHSGCPIIQALAFYGLRMTNHISNSQALCRALQSENTGYAREWLSLVIKPGVHRSPSDTARCVFSSKFGLTIGQQLDIERYFDTLDRIQPLNPPHLNFDNCIEAYDRYVRSVCVDDVKWQVFGEPPCGSLQA
jgi:hypothetical protein